MKTFSINNPRFLQLTRGALEPNGISPLRPGYSCEYKFALPFESVASACFVSLVAPELNRYMGQNITGTQKTQADFFENTLTFRWSSTEKDILQKYAGKKIPFAIEFESEGERYAYAEGILEIDHEFEKRAFGR